MNKKDLALCNLHRLMCHETKPNQTKPSEYCNTYTLDY